MWRVRGPATKACERLRLCVSRASRPTFLGESNGPTSVGLDHWERETAEREAGEGLLRPGCHDKGRLPWNLVGHWARQGA